MNTRTVSDPNEIRSILSDSTWKVKPRGMSVPEEIRSSLAGEIYQSFARMTDGDHHRELRHITEEIIADFDISQIERHVESAFNLLSEPSPRDIQYIVPGLVLSGLLDVPKYSRMQAVQLTRAFVVGSRANASPEEWGAAIGAVDQLVPIFQESPSSNSDVRIIAGRIAVLYQASDACAALVGNSILELAKHPDAHPQQIVNDSLADRLPIRSTIRARADDQVVLDLEAAHQVEPDAKWTFGHGAHACPGVDLAMSNAVEIVRYMQKHQPIDLASLIRLGWESLPNAWIPVLTHKQGGSK